MKLDCFSPFKACSVKTKVEAFEAVLNKGTVTEHGSGSSAVLPEARVLLKRLTSKELVDAGVDDQCDSSFEQMTEKRGTFVLQVPESVDDSSCEVIVINIIL